MNTDVDAVLVCCIGWLVSVNKVERSTGRDGRLQPFRVTIVTVQLRKGQVPIYLK